MTHLNLEQLKQKLALFIVGHEDVSCADRFIQDTTKPQDNREGVVRFSFFTHRHKYTIVAKPADDVEKSYLAGYGYCLYQNPGEHWHRGDDLPDGKMTMETLEHIMQRVIAYEVEPLAGNLCRRKILFSGENPLYNDKEVGNIGSEFPDLSKESNVP